MGHSFKVGDRVRRTGSACDDFKGRTLKVGDEAIVAKVVPDNDGLVLEGFGAFQFTTGRFELVGPPTIPCEPPAIDEVPAGSPVEAFAKLRAELAQERKDNALLRGAFSDAQGWLVRVKAELKEAAEDRDFWKRECGRTPAGKRLVEARERTAALKERG